MKQRIQIIVIIVVLVLIGMGAAVYKHVKLGFPLLPEKKETVWTVEATISFDADGGPAEVSLNIPDINDKISVLDHKTVAEGYVFKREGDRIVWRSKHAEGSQKIFFQSTAYRPEKGVRPDDHKIGEREDVHFTGPLKIAAGQIVSEAMKENTLPADVTAAIILALNDPGNDNAARLLAEAEQYGGKLNLTCGLLKKAGVTSRAVKGLKLTEKKTRQKLKGFIEVSDGSALLLFNPRTAEQENRDDFLEWQHNNESLLEIIGGSGGKVTFSTLSGKMPGRRAAVQHGRYSRDMLIDFSIYSLPVSQQNTFKLLLLIPIGALIVVILRNLVGIQTSGTFMPILIAMVFLQVNLLAGLSLFVIIVGIGLVLRSYLSSLNLLLVPRISAVLVFVIIIYVAISVISIKMGIEAGLRVTFFPMIIISWTIERMSILWEEEGPKDVFVQGGGSLFSASLIYLAMKNPYVGHLAFSFPELLLVVLAVIITIGSYSGYRLTELRRFEPLIKE